MSPVLSVLVTVTALVSLVSPVTAVTCYSCGPQVTPGCELSHLNNKLQEEDLARVQENGTCSLPHHAEYCSDTDWCVKTWRGNTSDPGQMTGDIIAGNAGHLGRHLDCVATSQSPPD